MPEEAVVEQPVVKQTVQSAIDLAKQNLELGDRKQEEKKVEKVEKTETKVETEDLSPEDLKLATDLFKALKDPEQAPAVVGWLAEKAGFTKKEARETVADLTTGTKKEQTEAKDEILQAFEEQFGEEFAAKLVPLFNRAIDKKVAERVKPTEDAMQSQQLSVLERESAQIVDSIANEFYDKGDMPKEVITEMGRLIDQYPPAKGQSQKEYLKDIHALAAARKGGSLKPVDTKKQERIDKNKSDVPSNLARNGRSPAPDGKQDISAEFAHIKNPLDRAIAIGKAQIDRKKD